MPTTLDTLISTDPPITVRESILSAIRRGAYPWVAAAAAGVSRKQFRAWVKEHRTFAHEVRRAAGWARLSAEMTLFDKDPRSWLRSGPGRESFGRPGWTKDVAARTDRHERRLRSPLADPAWRKLFCRMLEVLAPYPEARAALAELLRDQQRKGGAGPV